MQKQGIRQDSLGIGIFPYLKKMTVSEYVEAQFIAARFSFTASAS